MFICINSLVISRTWHFYDPCIFYKGYAAIFMIDIYGWIAIFYWTPSNLTRKIWNLSMSNHNSFFLKIVIGSARGNPAVHGNLIMVMGEMHLSCMECRTEELNININFLKRIWICSWFTQVGVHLGFISASSFVTPLKVWVWLFV